jgi:hypothetical protein
MSQSLESNESLMISTLKGVIVTHSPKKWDCQPTSTHDVQFCRAVISVRLKPFRGPHIVSFLAHLKIPKQSSELPPQKELNLWFLYVAKTASIDCLQNRESTFHNAEG